MANDLQQSIRDVAARAESQATECTRILKSGQIVHLSERARWLAISRTHLQEAGMAAHRAAYTAD